MSDHLNWSAVASYCDLGIKVFPIVWQSKNPLIAADWKTIATSDPVAARQLFPKHNRWNIGVYLGPASNICDIEVDSPRSAEALQTAFDTFGEPKTVAYKSSRGVHHWFRWNARLAEFGKSVLKWNGIECRLGTGDKGAYSVVPPSLHESGQCYYEWLPGRAPWEVPILDMPQWMVELWAAGQDRFESRSMVEVTRQGDDFVPTPGQRHQYLIHSGNLLAGALRLPRDLAEGMLMMQAEYFGKVADNGLEKTRKEVHDIVRTAMRSNLPDEDFPAIDFGSVQEQANTLVANMREEARYVPEYNTGIPSHIFPDFIQKFAEEAHKAQYSKDLVLMSVLGTVSAALGNSVRIRYAPAAPPMGVQLYSLGVAGASTGKSLVVNHMSSPMCMGKDYCTNATPEALIHAMYENPRGVLLKATEGASLPTMLGRYNQTGIDGEADNSVMLQAWSGEQMRVLRKTGDIEIETPFLSIIAATQPYGLNNFGVQATMDGWMQRTIMYRSPVVPDEADEGSLEFIAGGYKTYVDMVNRLKSIRPFNKMPVVAADFDEKKGYQPPTQVVQNIQPAQFILDREAYACWKAYAKAKRAIKTLSEFPEGHPFQADLMRQAEQALRVAECLYMAWLGLCLSRWAELQIDVLPQFWVPQEFVQRGIDLIEHCWEEKQELMTDIADDRYAKANPTGAVRAMESLPAYMAKFVTQRRKKLERAMKGSEPWSVRDYYRYLRLLQPAAETEIELMIKVGYVTQAGVRNKVNVFTFVSEKEISDGY